MIDYHSLSSTKKFFVVLIGIFLVISVLTKMINLWSGNLSTPYTINSLIGTIISLIFWVVMTIISYKTKDLEKLSIPIGIKTISSLLVLIGLLLQSLSGLLGLFEGFMVAMAFVLYLLHITKAI